MTNKARPGRAQIDASNDKDHLNTWVIDRVPALAGPSGLPAHVRVLAKNLLYRSRGLVVSSTMALSAAIVALRESAEFGRDSLELVLLEAVLRYSEEYQVPPNIVMRTLADEAPEAD